VQHAQPYKPGLSHFDDRHLLRRCNEWGFCFSAGAKLSKAPYVYSKYLSDRLLDRIADAAGVNDRLALDAELDLFRATVLDAAKLYDTALSLPEGEKGDQVRLTAGQILRDVLTQLGAMVERVLTCEQRRKDTLSVQSLHVVVAQIVDMAHEAFGEEPDAILKVRAFADRVKELRLPSDGLNKGTTITPDQQVIEMDATVPPPQELRAIAE